MKKVMTLLAFLTIPLVAMQDIHSNICILMLKLSSEKTTIGKVINISSEDKKIECSLGKFLFAFEPTKSPNDPTLDLHIRTSGEHATFVSSLRCPLLPYATSLVSFTYEGQPYTASIIPSELNIAQLRKSH